MIKKSILLLSITQCFITIATQSKTSTSPFFVLEGIPHENVLYLEAGSSKQTISKVVSLICPTIKELLEVQLQSNKENENDKIYLCIDEKYLEHVVALLCLAYKNQYKKLSDVLSVKVLSKEIKKYYQLCTKENDLAKSESFKRYITDLLHVFDYLGNDLIIETLSYIRMQDYSAPERWLGRKTIQKLVEQFKHNTHIYHALQKYYYLIYSGKLYPMYNVASIEYEELKEFGFINPTKIFF